MMCFRNCERNPNFLVVKKLAHTGQAWMRWSADWKYWTDRGWTAACKIRSFGAAIVVGCGYLTHRVLPSTQRSSSTLTSKICSVVACYWQWIRSLGQSWKFALSIWGPSVISDCVALHSNWFASIIVLIENGIVIQVSVFFNLSQTLFATVISFTPVAVIFVMLLARQGSGAIVSVMK